MVSFSRLLPAAVRKYHAPVQSPKVTEETLEVATLPAYPSRLSSGFVPKCLSDFGSGGAYPEIHLSQYPLNMGKKDQNTKNVLAFSSAHDNGNGSYSAIAKLGHGNDKKIYSSYTDIVEHKLTSDVLERPTGDEESKVAMKTKLALDKLVGNKIAASQPANVSRQLTAAETSSYYRYTPNPNAPGYNPATKQRIIRMVEAPTDPMEPPKFKHKKAPRGPPSPPVPVLHSPPRKITVQDQQSWKIPPCVSNWKNAKGYTIPLDKRLAADGRGLQEVTINDGFASLSEALSIAERKAREEVNMRAQVQKKISMHEKERKEAELREIASHARLERSGIEHTTTDRQVDEFNSQHNGMELQNRDKIRYERKRERERELRMEKLGKKGKLTRDDERDISEKIALGQLQGTGMSGKGDSEALYDSRLFNQNQGVAAGFGNEDDYNVYSKPMRESGGAKSIYRPKNVESDMYGSAETQINEISNTDRFRPDRDFQGVDRSTKASKREGPVTFEKEVVAADPFGLDEFLKEARGAGNASKQ